MLKLTIEDDRGYEGTAQAAITIHLKNVSNHPVWINRRLKIGPEDYHDREVWLDVTNPSAGERREWNCFAKGILRKTEDYMVLYGRTEYASSERLGCYAFPAAGTWQVTAHYRDENTHPPAGPVDVPWFVGTLTSNTIEVLVKEPLVAGHRL